MPSKLTSDQVIEKIKAAFDVEYGFELFEYVNSKIPVKLKCKTHGYFTQTPEKLFKGSGCQKCSKEKSNQGRSTPFSTFLKRSIKAHGEDRYEYFEDTYKGMAFKIKLKCNKCGKIFDQLAHGHASGKGCRKCKIDEYGETRRYSIDDFIKKANLVHAHKYDYSLINSFPKLMQSKVEIVCRDHGVFVMKANNHLNGQNCPECAKLSQIEKQSLSYDEFVARAVATHGEKYDYSNAKYVTYHEPLSIICPDHGEFFQSPASHIYGRSCPRCLTSHGEGEIRAFLLDKSFDFEEQKKFEGMKDRYHLKCDFYLPKINCVIEYNGRQHYEVVEVFGGEAEFKKTVKRDKIKHDYCKSNGINFEVIRHDEEVSTRMDEILRKYSDD